MHLAPPHWRHAPITNATHAEENTARQPFRLLELPKEIRLMIYEELSCISTKRYPIPLKNADHHITLVNHSVAGIKILATCRSLNSEASPIFTHKLAKIQEKPLKLIVKAEHLISLFSLRFGFTNEMNFLDYILSYPVNGIALESIHEYRKGKRPLAWLKQKLVCKPGMGKLDDETVKGLMTFVLRAAKTLEVSKSLNENEPPRIELVIETPYSYSPSIYTMTFSFGIILFVKLYKGINISRRLAVLGTLNWLIEGFARSTPIKCAKWSSLSFSALLRYSGELPDGMTAVISEPDFKQAILDGSQDLSEAVEKQVIYGGVVKDEVVEE